MDIQELNQFESAYQPSKEVAFCWLRKQYVQLSTEENHTEIVDHANDSLRIWQAAKAQAVPDLSELQERIAGHQYYHDEHGHMIVDMDDVVKEINGFDSWKAQAVLEKDAIIQKLSNQLYEQEMKTSTARVLCETACELLDDYAHQDAMVILDDLEQVMKEPVND